MQGMKIVQFVYKPIKYLQDIPGYSSVGVEETRESHDGKDKMYWIVIITITSGIRKTIG